MENPDRLAGTLAPPFLGRLMTQRVKKDAAIALAVLILFLCLWKLMTHPEHLGSAGPWLKTNVFGPFGAGVGQVMGLGGSTSGSQTADGTVGTGTSTQSAGGPTGNGTHPGSGPANGSDAGDSNKTANVTISNSLITVIGELDEQTNPPAVANPDAAAMARRLDEAGAKSGDIQFSLFWRNYNDLDLHCVDPMGIEIYYQNKRSALTGGELDIDQNAGGPPYQSTPVENIYWPLHGAPAGIYRLYVIYYGQHDRVGPTAYTVRTVVQDKTNYFHYTISPSWQHTMHPICTIQYDPSAADPSNRCRFLPNRW